jgi:hypothetical protein
MHQLAAGAAIIELPAAALNANSQREERNNAMSAIAEIDGRCGIRFAPEAVWKLDIDHGTENRSRFFGASDSSEGRKLQNFGLTSTKFDTPRFAAGVSAQPRPICSRCSC